MTTLNLNPESIKYYNGKMAKFMGLVKSETDGRAWFMKLDHAWTPYAEQLTFHKDYNELMKVVDTIENLTFHPKYHVRYRVNISTDGITIDFGDNTLGLEGTVIFTATNRFNALYFGLIEFINWYNSVINKN